MIVPGAKLLFKRSEIDPETMFAFFESSNPERPFFGFGMLFHEAFCPLTIPVSSNELKGGDYSWVVCSIETEPVFKGQHAFKFIRHPVDKDMVEVWVCDMPSGPNDWLVGVVVDDLVFGFLYDAKEEKDRFVKTGESRKFYLVVEEDD